MKTGSVDAGSKNRVGLRSSTKLLANLDVVVDLDLRLRSAQASYESLSFSVLPAILRKAEYGFEYDGRLLRRVGHVRC